MTFYIHWILLLTVVAGVFQLSSTEKTIGNDRDDTTEDFVDELQGRRPSSVDSRNDLPDLSDEVLRKFFDFVDEDDEPSKKKTQKTSLGKHKYPVKKNLHNSHYSHSHGPPSQSHLVTPGSHYKEDIHKPRNDGIPRDNASNDGKPVTIGNYQVSVVDATSPLLSSLGLKRHHLEQIAGSAIPASPPNSSPDLTSSESSHSASYAEHPRTYQAAPSYASYQKAPPNYGPPPHDNSPQYSHHSPVPYSGGSAPDPHSPHRAQSEHPPSHRIGYAPDSSYKYPNSYPPPPADPHYNSRYGPSDSWKPTGSSDYGPKIHYDQNEGQRHNPNYNRALWKQPETLYPPHPPPLPYKNQPETQDLNPSYKAPAKPALGAVSPYHKTESSYSKPSYASSSDHYSSSSSSYSSGRPSSSSYKTPSRAGSISHDSYHTHSAPSKPGISISFKAKTPGHGVSIPINFNPLDVVKKIALPLSALNPLANKKVTIGITIENKDTHHQVPPHY